MMVVNYDGNVQNVHNFDIYSSGAMRTGNPFLGGLLARECWFLFIM